MDTPTPPVAERVNGHPLPLRVLGFFLALAAFLLLVFGGMLALVAAINGPETIGVLVLLFLLNVALLIHVLGHLITAWLCGVQVWRVGFGLGPAVPGCRFVIGETTFRVNLIPLGGYARIVRSGPDVEKPESYSRALANKPWWKRLLVYTSGPLANLLAACVFFLLSLGGRESQSTPGVVGSVEPGTVPWEEGVRSGWVVERLDDRVHPSFEEMQALATVTRRGEKVPAEIRPPGGTSDGVSTALPPLRDGNPLGPGFGLHPVQQLELNRPRGNVDPDLIVNPLSPAADARVLEMPPGSLIVGTTDPEPPHAFVPLAHDFSTRTWDEAEFHRRLRTARGKPLHVRYLQPRSRLGRWVLRECAVPAEGFQPGDRIIASSRFPAAGARYDPFDIDPLPPAPGVSFPGPADPTEFRRRLLRALGRPFLIQVVNPSYERPRTLYVPPAYRQRLPGVRLKMGEIAALRKQSAAAREGVRPRTPTASGDVIVGARMESASGQVLHSRTAEDLDPESLPEELLRAALGTPGQSKRVTLTLARRESEVLRDCTLAWDEDWAENVEFPTTRTTPLSIPALGLAYWIECEVAALADDSPARQAGLRPGDVIRAVRFYDGSSRPANPDRWSLWDPLAVERGGKRWLESWAYASRSLSLQRHDRIQVLISRNGKDLIDPLDVRLAPDPSWPCAERGMTLRVASQNRKVDALKEAIPLGFADTFYLNQAAVERPRALLTLSTQLSLAVLTTPLDDRDFNGMLLFILGALNVNLVLVNLLPLPYSDGGRLLRSLWQRLPWRGKSPCDTPATATTIPVENGGG